MSFEFEIKKKNVIFYVLWLLVGAIPAVVSDVRWWLILIYAVLAFAFACMHIKLPEKLSWLWSPIAMAVGAALTVFSIQYALLDAEDFAKTSDTIWWVNTAIALAFYLVVLAISNSTRISCAISSITLLVFGYIDYFVYEFRGNEFTYADLRSAGTGLSVASNYDFVIDYKFAYTLMALILYNLMLKTFEIKFRTKAYPRLIAVLVAIISVLFVIMHSMDLNTETWEKKGTYRNGYLLNFVLGIRDSFVSAPEGYDTEKVKALESNYSKADSSKSESDVENPTIIVIMNESFSDLSVVGDFETNMTVTPFIDSLKENTIKGYALSSVYGAKTPNSEWEFMTGNSMAFLPEGSVVYQQYIKDDATSIVSTLKNVGYTCVAMHPYYATGWSRNKIYPNLGYDEMYFMDDFDQNNILREYITDQELYDGIIDRFESKSDDENLYIMGITMQNHGGYGADYDNFNEEVYKLGYSYTDGNQYLSLLHESDKAIQNLVEYFESVDEPVEIVFFGDHQPGLCNSFIELLNGKGNSGLSEEELENLYTVPFFIWTNYETQAEDVEITSLNYLSTLTLERANIDLPAYNQFLADMMEVVPAINSRGYYSKSNGGYIHLDEATGEEAEWIQNYNILQYNGMFDEKNKSSLFFPNLKG